ncbi:MAG: DNA alkylation repair protein [Flavobacteriaceae bacterium]
MTRKGARKQEDIPEQVLLLLNKGDIETVNLTEWLAIDHVQLIRENLPKIGVPQDVMEHLASTLDTPKKRSAMNCIKQIGELLYQSYGHCEELLALFEKLASYKSDSIRCYAPYLISLNTDLDIGEKLKYGMPLAADKHFGVREVVWMALRPEIEPHLDEVINLLSRWAEHPDGNIRRFASEITRPRGVWCKHLERLKTTPELALPILEKLRSDSSSYVRDSVGNWLNDASKSQPNFVIALCQRWERESPTPETQKIVKRAKRTINGVNP